MVREPISSETESSPDVPMNTNTAYLAETCDLLGCSFYHQNVCDGKEKPLEEIVVMLLKERQMTVTTAESCTGGKLSGRIINVSGVSSVYKEGYITYANESKEKILGVRHETLEKFGAVSEETAYEMAVGARRVAGADTALSVTGIAGPDGGTKEKPVGLVYIGCVVGDKVTVQRFQFDGNREMVRDCAVAQALTMLREALIEE